MGDRYTLNEQGKPIPCDDLLEWARWFETANRHVAETYIGNVRISTVFLGLDHDFGGGGEPILWETMVFGGKLDEHQTRCCGSMEQAEAMHHRMVQRVKKSTNLLSRFFLSIPGLLQRYPAGFLVFCGAWNAFSYGIDHDRFLGFINAAVAGSCLTSAFWLKMKFYKFK